jgi:hypothetical protein
LDQQGGEAEWKSELQRPLFELPMVDVMVQEAFVQEAIIPGTDALAAN